MVVRVLLHYVCCQKFRNCSSGGRAGPRLRVCGVGSNPTGSAKYKKLLGSRLKISHLIMSRTKHQSREMRTSVGLRLSVAHIREVSLKKCGQ